MAFSVTVSLPASVFSSFVMANEKFVFQRLLQIIQVIVSPVVTLLVLLLGYRSIGMASVVVGVVLVTTAVNIWFSVKKLRMRFSFRGLDGAMLREIAVFSSYIFVNIVIDQVNWNVDKFILGRVGGTVAVAVYALGAQLNTYYVSLSSAVSSVFIPRVHRLVAAADDDLELTRLFTRVGRVQFLILALAGGALVVFGRRFISVWAGANYAGAYTIALFLVIPVTIPLMQNLGIEIQRAKNLHQFRSWLYLGIAVVNVAVSIPLAQRYGGAGAAAGTAAALIVGNGLIMNIYYHKRVGLDMKYFWRAIAGFVPALVPVVITGAVIMLFADMTDLLRMAAWGLAYIGVYCVSMWFLGMNDYEHDLISRPVVRLRTRWKMTAG
jgi:O-antigen/teichoic acid export membrane protein